MESTVLLPGATRVRSGETLINFQSRMKTACRAAVAIGWNAACCNSLRKARKRAIRLDPKERDDEGPCDCKCVRTLTPQ